MAKRIRVMGWAVTPILVVDDGEELTVAQAQPRQFSTKELVEFAEVGHKQMIRELQRELDSAEAPLPSGNGAGRTRARKR